MTMPRRVGRKDDPNIHPENQARVRGAQAFADGIPRNKNPWGPFLDRCHSRNWDAGWIKAKLAAEQGKTSL